MRSSLLMSAALLGLSAGAALAQNSVGSAQSPAAPNASSQGPQPANSVPSGASTSTMPTPGSNIGTTAMPGYVSGGAMAPGAEAPRGRAMAPHMARRGYRARGAEVTAGEPEQNAPPTSAYRGGAGSPFSTQASNINGANARSEIAPRLPDPNAASSTPEAYLAAAHRALQQRRTGAAQEALERAETRILSRTTDPSMAGTPDQAAMVQHIGEARRALGNRDVAAADAAVMAAMNAPVPPRGPTVTYGQPGPGPGAPPPRY